MLDQSKALRDYVQAGVFHPADHFDHEHATALDYSIYGHGLEGNKRSRTQNHRAVTNREKHKESIYGTSRTTKRLQAL